jgi:hypothetical protein
MWAGTFSHGPGVGTSVGGAHRASTETSRPRGKAPPPAGAQNRWSPRRDRRRLTATDRRRLVPSGRCGRRRGGYGCAERLPLSCPLSPSARGSVWMASTKAISSAVMATSGRNQVVLALYQEAQRTDINAIGPSHLFLASFRRWFIVRIKWVELTRYAGDAACVSLVPHWQRSRSVTSVSRPTRHFPSLSPRGISIA